MVVVVVVVHILAQPRENVVGGGEEKPAAEGTEEEPEGFAVSAPTDVAPEESEPLPAKYGDANSRDGAENGIRRTQKSGRPFVALWHQGG